MAASAASKRSRGTSRTTSAYIWMNRRYESNANRRLPVAVARPSTLASFSPRLRMVSIIPGIDSRAPLRTDTRSGSAGSPSRFPASSSSRARWART